MAKKKETQSIVEKIYNYSLEEIMGDRFGKYSKEIIQERALPDVRDGLKPVQRRILFSMFEAHYTHDKQHRKCARVVGDVMGKYHPHGDSSIYEALIRMSQPWKMREPFIEVHGNNGSIDGDGPAAMRYTECRLTKFASVLLKDLDKETVTMAYNFDDTELEPTVLPAGFPNLLVNGSTGISAGYATNIPPHNLGEVIDATIKRIEAPNCSLDTILNIIPGPDFPTGAIACGKENLRKAYETGKGKVVVKARTTIEKVGNKKRIIVEEIPYEVLKEQLRKKIEEIRIDKKIEGITDVIDDSDQQNMARLIIEVKKEADPEVILNYLLKNTELQINFNYNMVAIVNRRPKLVGILDILDAFITHQREVITKRTEFELKRAKVRYHILEGLMKAISILDDVIRVIRSSSNKANAIDNLVQEFAFSKEQATAIVMLQLYRLTNTDIVEVQEEMASLLEKIKIWEQILNNEEALKHVMKNELKIIKKEFATPRKTTIEDEITEIKLDKEVLIPKENAIVVVTKDGYIKRISAKSYAARSDDPIMKPGDCISALYDVTTLDNILIFTNLGNYLFLPVHKIPEGKWKDLGKHVNNIVTLSDEEKVISSALYNESDEIITVTKNGMIKRTKMMEYYATRISKAMVAMKLKDNDEVVTAITSKDNILVVSKQGYYCAFAKTEVPLVGVRGSGVRAMNLKDDEVVSCNSFNELEYVTIFTNQKTAKRLKACEFQFTGRAKRGNTLIKKVKSTPYEIIATFLGKNFVIYNETTIENLKSTEISIMDLSSTGSSLPYTSVSWVLEEPQLEAKEEVPVKEEEVEVVPEQVSFNLDDFKL